MRILKNIVLFIALKSVVLIKGAYFVLVLIVVSQYGELNLSWQNQKQVMFIVLVLAQPQKIILYLKQAKTIRITLVIIIDRKHLKPMNINVLFVIGTKMRMY